MPHDELTCGCAPTQPCPRGAELFARGPRGRQYLYRHIEAGMREFNLRGLHAWEYTVDGVVLSRCRRCKAEQAAGNRWRAAGGEWQTGAMPECVGREVELAKMAKVRAAARRRRAA